MKKLLVFALIASASAYAAEVELGPSHIQGSSSYQGSITENESKNIVLITKEDIAKKNYPDLVAIFQDSPVTMVTHTPAGPLIALRGSGEKTIMRVKVLLDGNNITSIDEAMGVIPFNAIPVSSIEKIEIIPGGGISLYGSGSSSGVINIVTKQGVTKDYGQVNLGFSSFHNRELSLNKGLSLGDKVFVNVALEGKKGNGYRDEDKASKFNLMSSVNYQINDKNKLKVSYAKFHENRDTTDEISLWELKRDRRKAGESLANTVSNRDAYAFDYQYSPTKNLDISLNYNQSLFTRDVKQKANPYLSYLPGEEYFSHKPNKDIRYDAAIMHSNIDLKGKFEEKIKDFKVKTDYRYDRGRLNFGFEHSDHNLEREFHLENGPFNPADIQILRHRRTDKLFPEDRLREDPNIEKFSMLGFNIGFAMFKNADYFPGKYLLPSQERYHKEVFRDIWHKIYLEAISSVEGEHPALDQVTSAYAKAMEESKKVYASGDTTAIAAYENSLKEEYKLGLKDVAIADVRKLIQQMAPDMIVPGWEENPMIKPMIEQKINELAKGIDRLNEDILFDLYTAKVNQEDVDLGKLFGNSIKVLSKTKVKPLLKDSMYIDGDAEKGDVEMEFTYSVNVLDENGNIILWYFDDDEMEYFTVKRNEKGEYVREDGTVLSPEQAEDVYVKQKEEKVKFVQHIDENTTYGDLVNILKGKEFSQVGLKTISNARVDVKKEVSSFHIYNDFQLTDQLSMNAGLRYEGARYKGERYSQSDLVLINQVENINAVGKNQILSNLYKYIPLSKAYKMDVGANPGGLSMESPNEQLQKIYDDLYDEFVENGQIVIPMTYVASRVDKKEDNIGGEIGFNYKINDDNTVYTKFERAFNTPLPTQLTNKTFDPVNRVKVYWDSNLKTEMIHNFEIGFRGALTDNVTYSLAGFMSDTKDEIVTLVKNGNSHMNREWRFINLEKTRRLGIELQSEQFFDKLHLKESFTYVDPKIISNDYKSELRNIVANQKNTLLENHRYFDKGYLDKQEVRGEMKEKALEILGKVYNDSMYQETATDALHQLLSEDLVYPDKKYANIYDYSSEEVIPKYVTPYLETTDLSVDEKTKFENIIKQLVQSDSYYVASVYDYIEKDFKRTVDSGNYFKKGDRIPLAPKVKATFGADYQFTDRLKLGMNMTYVGDYYTAEPSYGYEIVKTKVDGHFLTDLYGRYNFTPETSVKLGINNVFNHEYNQRQDSDTAVPAAGRTYSIGISHRF